VLRSHVRSHAGASLSVCGHNHRLRVFWLMRVTILVSADHVFTAMVWILLTHWKQNYLMGDGSSIQSTHTVTVTLRVCLIGDFLTVARTEGYMA
jgi:hypothetical protein